MRSFTTGFLTGFPLMIVLGPIAVLLMETGLGHGMRRGWRAAGGVAAADTVFAVAALLGGRVVAEVLAAWQGTLHLVAGVVLAGIALHMAFGALTAWRSSQAPALLAVGPGGPVGPVGPGGPVGLVGPNGEIGVDMAMGPPSRGESSASLAGRFFMLSIANPMTIMAFATIVLASGQKIAGPGWVGGIAAASFVAHASFVGAGAGLGSVVTSDRGLAGVRLVGVLVVLGLAAHFAIG